MDLSLPAVVGWLFVAIFAAVAVIVLLDLAGIRRIADESQRKWLFRGLIVSVVTAVAGLGTAYLKHWDYTDKPLLENVAESNSAAPAKAAVLPPARPKAPTPAPSSIGAPAPAEAAQCPADRAVLEWAAANLGPRPTLQPGFDRDYPTCVADLAAQQAPDANDIEQCLKSLEVHRVKTLQNGFYDAKQSYDEALLKWERQMRRGGITEEERPSYNYIVCENEDLNDPGGKSLEVRDAAEERLRIDRRACRKSKCQTPP